ncbi:MAG: N-acetylmuramoyl-L-alanine amidase LytC [Firmicutes bacterium]|nr:N-acetylmuramoyl-L-alanine amidase LytC [Bacillota bacterium]MBT9176558.1 N-acetylmuramoyl-L-alanine amidase LytC [Bacillota bacterium]
MILATDGGRQPGAVGPTGVQEKVVCLNVALRVQELLRLRIQANVHLTRSSDITVPLGERLPHAEAACFVSIHCNAAVRRDANGTETFYFASGHHDSARLANILQRELLARLRLRDRGVKTAVFQVIRQARCPAALVELAFISNHVEEALLESEIGQERAAQAIAAGVAEFLQATSQAARPTIQPATQPISSQAKPVSPPPAAARPAAASRPAATVRPAARRTHAVVAGDTLWSIARQYGVTVAQLREWNQLATDVVHPGQGLFVS